MILLVLAGVVVNFSLGENGIIAKAQTAVDKYKQAAENEQIELAKYEKKIDNARDSISEDRIREIIQDETSKKSIITANMSENKSTTATSENIVFNNVFSNQGNAFQIENGGIKINKDISHIKVSAQVYFTTGIKNGEVPMASLVKNESYLISTCNRSPSDAGYITLHLDSILVDVQKNDIIYININNFNGPGKVISGGSTYITVEEV